MLRLPAWMSVQNVPEITSVRTMSAGTVRRLSIGSKIFTGCVLPTTHPAPQWVRECALLGGFFLCPESTRNQQNRPGIECAVNRNTTSIGTKYHIVRHGIPHHQVRSQTPGSRLRCAVALSEQVLPRTRVGGPDQPTQPTNQPGQPGPRCAVALPPPGPARDPWPGRPGGSTNPTNQPNEPTNQPKVVLSRFPIPIP